MTSLGKLRIISATGRKCLNYAALPHTVFRRYVAPAGQLRSLAGQKQARLNPVLAVSQRSKPVVPGLFVSFDIDCNNRMGKCLLAAVICRPG